MGFPMASNLLRSGYRLAVCDPNQEAVSRLVSHGATIVDTPAQLASMPGMFALVSMLPSAKSVKEAYLGAQGVLSLSEGNLQPHLIIDSSTIDPCSTKEVAEVAESTFLHPDSSAAHDNTLTAMMIDAPVSGGVPGAQAASLTFMCGGSEKALTAAKPLLESMGKRVVHCGGHGAGQAAKLANNLALAVSMAGIAEALAFGIRLGLDPKLLTEIFNSSSARCWSSDTYNPCPGVQEGVPSSRGYTGGFASSLMVKDLGLAEMAATAVGAALPMTQAVKGLYKKTVEEYDPKLDFSAIFETVYGGKPTHRHK